MEAVMLLYYLKKYLLKNKLNIQTWCSVQNGTIICNGKKIVAIENKQPFSEFAKQVYKNQQWEYPKFYKMDRLSKLTFMTAEILMDSITIPSEEKEGLAVVLSNKSASLDTDRTYQDSINSIEDFYPSPAVFVYTLPNIGMGEVCIRHKIQSENAFFVFDDFNPLFLKQYAESLISNDKARQVLCGWTEIDEKGYNSFLYLASPNEPFRIRKKQLQNYTPKIDGRIKTGTEREYH